MYIPFSFKFRNFFKSKEGNFIFSFSISLINIKGLSGKICLLFKDVSLIKNLGLILYIGCLIYFDIKLFLSTVVCVWPLLFSCSPIISFSSSLLISCILFNSHNFLYIFLWVFREELSSWSFWYSELFLKLFSLLLKSKKFLSILLSSLWL